MKLFTLKDFTELVNIYTLEEKPKLQKFPLESLWLSKAVLTS